MLLIGFRINSKIFKSCLFLFRRKHLDNLFHFINGGRIFLETKIVAAQSIQKVPIIGKWLIFSTKLLNMNKSLLGHSFHFLFFFFGENFAIYRNSFSTSSMCHVYMGIKIYLRKINVIGLKLLWFFF